MIDGFSCPASGGVQCPVCALSKQRRQDVVRAPAPRVRVVQPNAQVSVDLHGPYAEPAVSGALHAAVFVDTYTRYTFVRTIRNKNDVADNLLQYCATVGRPREVITDWGSEFAGKFIRVCLDKEIRIRHSCPYTPWQNGHLERRDQSLINTSLGHFSQTQVCLRNFGIWLCRRRLTTLTGCAALRRTYMSPRLRLCSVYAPMLLTCASLVLRCSPFSL